MLVPEAAKPQGDVMLEAPELGPEDLLVKALPRHLEMLCGEPGNRLLALRVLARHLRNNFRVSVIPQPIGLKELPGLAGLES